MHIVGNTITNNNGVCVFYEISDLLYLIDNDLQCGASNSVKLAGSSGLYVINNTMEGGPDTFGVYADRRSRSGCARYRPRSVPDPRSPIPDP